MHNDVAQQTFKSLYLIIVAQQPCLQYMWEHHNNTDSFSPDRSNKVSTTFPWVVGWRKNKKSGKQTWIIYYAYNSFPSEESQVVLYACTCVWSDFTSNANSIVVIQDSWVSFISLILLPEVFSDVRHLSYKFIVVIQFDHHCMYIHCQSHYD